MIFEAYFDESGCDDSSKVMVVGGYLIEAQNALKMERAWKRVLKQYSLPHFHMVDCAHGNEAFAKMHVMKRIKIQTQTDGHN